MNGYRFLGLTKTQWVIGLMAMAMVILGLQLYLLWENRLLAQEGAESHAALCANRVSVQRQVTDSKAFLALTRAQRIKKYGAGIGKIPVATIKLGLDRQEVYLAALDRLHC